MPEILESTGTPTPATSATATAAADPATAAPTMPTQEFPPEPSSPPAPAKGSAERPQPKAAAVTLTISEAARACDVNRRTIRHHRQAGDFPGTFKDQEGMWRIPVEDLEWVGFHPDLGRASEDPMATGKVDLLRTEVAVLRERLRAAELIAMEREKRIDDLRLILRLLPSTSVGSSPLGAGAARLAAGPARLTAGRTSPEPAPAVAADTDSDQVIWLPDAPDDRAVPVGGPLRSEESDRGSIWTPGGSSLPREEADDLPETHDQPEDSSPRFFGPPVEIRVRRHRWLPWRRSRE